MATLRKSTKVWLAVFVAGIAAASVSWPLPLARLGGLGVLAVAVSATVLAWRAGAIALRRFLYRLSWRMVFSYFLIGVVPVPLLAVLLCCVAYLTAGQFESYRVRSALDRLGAEMSAGRLPGTKTARVRAGRVAESGIPGIGVGLDAGAWARELSRPRFFGVRAPDFLAVYRGDAREGTLFAAERDTRDFTRRLAQESGVALLTTAPAGTLAPDRSHVGIELRLGNDQKRDLAASRQDFAYPYAAGPDDRSSAPWKTVSWLCLSRPVLLQASGGKAPDVVALITRLSWGRIAADLFGQEVIRGRNWVVVLIVSLSAFLLAVYLIALVIAFALVLRITRTVNAISRATGRIREGDFSVRIATRARDQVGDLARSFDSMAASLSETLRDRAAREALEREVAQAKEIATRLLPVPGATVPGLETGAFFEPFSQIGGDYYDFFSIGGRPFAVVGDVSGHGLPTALLVATAKAALDTLLDTGLRRGDLFARLDVLLHRSTDPRSYMTLALVEFLDDSRIALTNAGHPPPFLVSRGRVRPLELPALPLGLFPGRHFPTAEFPMSAGDRLVLYTDGLVECRDSRDDAFGFDRLAAAIEANAGAPIPELQGAILQAVAAHCGDVPFDDDRTLVICERA